MAAVNVGVRVSESVVFVSFVIDALAILAGSGAKWLLAEVRDGS